MRGLLPPPLLVFAGVVAPWPVATVVRGPTSTPSRMVEAFVTTLAVIALVWLAWVTLCLIEQRW